MSAQRIERNALAASASDIRMTFISERVFAAGERRKCCAIVITLYGEYDMALDKRLVKRYVTVKGEKGSAMEAAATERPAPPKPTPRKERAINIEYEAKATALVRDAMRERGVSVAELHKRLTGMGVAISEGGLANKISRGSFSSVFLLQCLDALDIDVSAIPTG